MQKSVFIVPQRHSTDPEIISDPRWPWIDILHSSCGFRRQHKTVASTICSKHL